MGYNDQINATNLYWNKYGQRDLLIFEEQFLTIALALFISVGTVQVLKESLLKMMMAKPS